MKQLIKEVERLQLLKNQHKFNSRLWILYDFALKKIKQTVDAVDKLSPLDESLQYNNDWQKLKELLDIKEPE